MNEQTNIAAALAATGDGDDLLVRDIMTVDLETLTPEASLRDAMELLALRHVTGVPVVIGQSVVGVITASDLMSFVASTPGVPTETEGATDWAEWAEEASRNADDNSDEAASAFYVERWDDAGADASERMAYPEAPEWNVLEEHDVSEAMTRAIVAISPQDTVLNAVGLMRDRAIHRLLVMTGECLVGIVSTTDVTRAVADGDITRIRR